MTPIGLRLTALAIATAAVVGTAAVVATVERERTSAYWLTVATLIPGIVYVYEMVSGLLGLLSSAVLLALSTVGLLGAAAWSRRSDAEPAPAIRRRLAETRETASAIAASRLSVVLAALAFATFLWITAVALATPPIAWDALLYHLPPVVQWLQAGDLHWVEIGFPFYPKNGELFVLWPTVFLRRQTVMNAAQIYFGLLAGLAVYALARELSIDRDDAVVASSFVFLSPIVITQSITAYVDLTFAGLLAASVAFLAMFVRTGAVRHLAMLGLATGLMMGVKSSGLVAAAAIWLVAVGVTVADRPREAESIAARIGLLTATIAVFGGYWYLRTWLRLGSPVYPLSVDILGATLFEGAFGPERVSAGPWRGTYAADIHAPYEDTTMLSRLYASWWEKTPIYGKSIPVGGWGPQWAILGVPALLSFGYDAVTGGRTSRLVVLGVVAAPVFIGAPFYARYAMILLVLGGLAVAHVRQKGSPVTRRGVSLLFLVAVIVSAGMASAYNPWRYDDVVSSGLTGEGFDSATAARPGKAPIGPANYSAVIPPGSTIGYVPRGPVSYGAARQYDALPFTFYDAELTNELVYLSDVSSVERLDRRLREDAVDILLVHRNRSELATARASSLTEPVWHSDDWQALEVNR